MCYVDKVIQIEQAEVGYLEKKSNANLHDKTANAGRKNYTKYARDYAAWGDGDYQGQAWCDMFQDWAFVQAYGVENARRLLGGFSAYTPTSAQYFKNVGRWSQTPQRGALVFFKNTERIHHIGLVTDVRDGKIYTIEGNTSGAAGVVDNGGGVWEKSYDVNNSRIAGYGMPAYDTQKGDWDGVDTKQFVKDMYVQIMGREADESGLKTWTDFIAAGHSFREVYEGFIHSNEGRRHFVQELYHHLLGRDGSADEVAFWVDQLAAGMSQEEVYKGFTGSAEYKRVHE